MGWAYLVLAVIAVLGLALGWRLTPAPREPASTEGVARLLQLAIALTGLAVLALLLVPWLSGLSEAGCTPEAERAGECIMGLRERGLFGTSAFTCLCGAAFAFVLRKGVLDFPPPGPVHESAREAGVGDLDTMSDFDQRGRKQDKPEPKTKAAPKAKGPAVKSKADDADARKDLESKAEEPRDEQPKDEPEPASADASAEAKPAGHRRLEGPVFRAFVDDQAVEIDVAIETAAERLRSERVAVVFSRGASKDANVALLELAEAFDAYRYVLEGTAAATEGVPSADEPDPHAADEVAGPKARHAGELALDLAGSFIQTVFLLDTRVAFPEFVLGKLTELQSVCIAHAHDDVSAACQVVLPGTNPGEREGELIDSGGGANARRPRAQLVAEIVTALRELEGGKAEDTPTDAHEAEARAEAEAEAEAAKAESKTEDAKPKADDS